MQNDYFSGLTPKEREIIVDKGTESPFTGKYNDHFEAGVFICRACKNPLYESNTKFNSGCGWPSFDDEIIGSINRNDDHSLGRHRIEICCAKCDGHLGHVFSGENITKKDTRHCVNSLSIEFKSYKNLRHIFLAGGCFWTIEKIFKNIKGVYMTQCGYMGGKIKDPSYEDVCTGKTDHAEVVQIYFDDKVINFDSLLDIFWDNHNPTSINEQGRDQGTQYRSVIFYTSLSQKGLAEESKVRFQKLYEDKDIITQIIKSEYFYRAEEYHQDYLNKNNLDRCPI
tara:strand:- start:475 stop:1320 length:846 start_codon:yes stop_codon:yes gene_type:complete